jgi:tRNA(Ile)-lysidine synthase
MNLPDRFLNFIPQQNLFSRKDKLLLAVSGGIDSVVLCELCHQTDFDFAIAHCNFQLRGDESNRDENFVKQLAQKYNKEIFIKKIETEKYAAENKVSIQVAARDLRYEWFHEIVNAESTVHYILTAHHLDDNIETVLMNFFKGTGIAGLHGILPKQGKIIRPLLFASKEELKKFAVDNNLQWVEDSSNKSDKYARNYFRHQVIPLVEEIYPGAIHNLSANIERFREAETLYYQSISLHKKKLLQQKGNEIHIPLLKLKKSEPLRTIIYEIIKDYHFSPNQIEEIINLLDSESGKYIQSSSHRIIKNRNWLIISPNNLKEAENILIDEIGSWQLEFAKLHLDIRSSENYKLQITNTIAQLDADKVKFPLLLRKWKQGDYFYPLGMKKKKKVARFLIDNKLSQTDKEKIRVIEMNKKIIWIAGMRIDDRFKITPQTKNVLLIQFQ